MPARQLAASQIFHDIPLVVRRPQLGHVAQERWNAVSGGKPPDGEAIVPWFFHQKGTGHGGPIFTVFWTSQRKNGASTASHYLFHDDDDDDDDDDGDGDGDGDDGDDDVVHFTGMCHLMIF